MKAIYCQRFSNTSLHRYCAKIPNIDVSGRIAIDEWESRIRDSNVVPERLGPTMKIGAVMRASCHLGRFAFPNVSILLAGPKWEGNQRGRKQLSIPADAKPTLRRDP